MRFAWPWMLLGLLAAVAYVELAVATAMALLFVCRYSRRPWRRSPEGRHLMGMTATLAGLTGLTLLFAVVPAPPLVGVSISVVAFGVLCWQLWVRLRLLRTTGAPRSARV